MSTLLDDILTREVLSLPPATSLREALAFMEKHAISSILVTEDLCPLGIFTERDAVMLAGRLEDLSGMTVGDVMSAPLVTVRPCLELHDAYQLMADNGFRHLVVADDDERLVGVVSEGDFASHLDSWYLKQLDHVEAVMTRNIIGAGPKESVAQGVRRMADRRISCIVVGSPDRAEGILTERDVVRLLSSRADLGNTLLEDVIHRPVHSIRQSEPLHLARERMQSLGVRRLLVTDAANNWKGLITRHDLLCGLEQNHWRNLQESEAHFRLLYEEAPLPYQSLDEQGRLLAVNGAWEQALGYSRSEILGRFIGDFHVPGQEEKLRQVLLAFVEGGAVEGMLFEFLCRDGSRKTMSATSRIGRDGNGRFQRTHCILVDVTRQEQAESQLRDSEQRFREVLENIEDVFWMTDPRTSQVLYVNPAYENLWDHSREELYKAPRSFLERVHPQDRARVTREIEGLAKGIYHDMEYRVIRPDGSEIRVRDRAFPVHDSNGEVYRVAGIIQDVTALHRTSAALKESEARFRSLFEHAAAGLTTSTPDGRLTEVNRAFADILGYAPEELAGKTIRAIIHPDDWGAHQEMLDAIDQGERSTCQLQERYLKKDGSPLWMRVSSAGVCDEQGELKFFVSLQQDIDRLKRTEARLNEQLAERASLLDAAPVGIGLVRDRGFQWLSQRFLDMLGYAEDELLGRSVRCIYPSDQEYERVGTIKYAQVEATGSGEIETVMRHRDGHELHVLLRSTAVDRQDLSAGVIFTALDMTERKEAEKDLRLFRTLMDHSKDILLVADAESAEIKDFNQAACSGLGYSREELSSLKILDITDMFDIGPQAWQEHVGQIEERNELTFETELRLKDGGLLPVEVSVRRVLHLEKTYLIGIARNITEVRNTRQALMDKNEELEALLNTIPSPVYFKNSKLRYRMVNRAFLEFTGLSVDQVIGRTDAEIFSAATAEAFRREDRDIIEHRCSLIEREQELHDASGKAHWVSTAKTPLIYGTGQVVGLVGISTDITPLRELNEQRLAKEQALRDTLIREVHHRIKNHLQGVVGMLRNMADSCTDIEQCLEKAIGQVRTIATVYGLHGQSGKARLQIGKLLQACINAYPAEDAARIEYRQEGPTPLDLAREESVPVALVVNELIANAIKHSNTGGPKQPIEVSLSTRAHSVRLYIANPGGKLPDGFDFAKGKGLGTGLELLRTLLPPQGAHLGFRQEEGRVVAELTLEPPAVLPAV